MWDGDRSRGPINAPAAVAPADPNDHIPMAYMRFFDEVEGLNGRLPNDFSYATNEPTENPLMVAQQATENPLMVAQQARRVRDGDAGGEVASVDRDAETADAV